MLQQIFLQYAFPLDQDRRELAETRGVAYPSISEVQASIEQWNVIWNEVNVNQRVLNRLSELTRAVLPYPIEANVIGGMFRPMSRPFILVTHDQKGRPISKEDFLHTCIHEIIHRYISENQRTDERIQAYWKMVAEEYPQETQITRVHILVYAFLAIVLPEFCGESTWVACQQITNPSYIRALELMKTKGAQACVTAFNGDIRIG